MRLSKLFAFLLIAFFASVSLAQTANISGKYEGTADLQGAGKIKVTAEIRQIDGKISGFLTTPFGDATIVEGKFNDGSLSLTLDAGGDDIFIEAKSNAGGKISGEVSGEIAKGTIELIRLGDAPPLADSTVNLNLTKAQWREDVRFLADQLAKRHKNAFNLISRQEYEHLFSELDGKIPNLSNDEIVLEMSRIVSRIGDGHTKIDWSGLFPKIPLHLYWFGKELRVAEAAGEFPRLSGVRVTKIGGIAVEEIYERSRRYIAAHESEQFVLNASVNLLTYPIFLKQIGAAKSNDTAVYEFVSANGKRFSQSIKAISPHEKREYLKFYKDPPLALQKPDAPFYYEYLKDAKTVYVNFRWYPRRAEFRQFSAELFDLIDHTDIEKLVFDLRQNGGGDFTRGRDFFIKPLQERKKFAERGHLFVLAGRATFSAGMTNTADFRTTLNAIIVGEPTGARPVGYMENRSFALPNSHLPVSYSTEFYKFAETDTPGILPDKLIAPDWKSYSEGRDAALEWILAEPKMR